MKMTMFWYKNRISLTNRHWLVLVISCRGTGPPSPRSPLQRPPAPWSWWHSRRRSWPPPQRRPAAINRSKLQVKVTSAGFLQCVSLGSRHCMCRPWPSSWSCTSWRWRRRRCCCISPRRSRRPRRALERWRRESFLRSPSRQKIVFTFNTNVMR